MLQVGPCQKMPLLLKHIHTLSDYALFHCCCRCCRMAANPGVKVVLSLVASVNETSVMQLLGLGAGSTNTTAGRHLLSADVDSPSHGRRLQASCYPNCVYVDAAAAAAFAANATASAANYSQAANKTAQELVAACRAAQAADSNAVDSTGQPVGTSATSAAVDAARNAASAASQAAIASAAANQAMTSGNLTAASAAANQADLALATAQNWSSVAASASASGMPACMAVVSGTTADWAYFADYAVEDVPPFVSLDAPPLPPTYSSNAGLGPDAGNAVELKLANSSAVHSYTGVCGLCASTLFTFWSVHEGIKCSVPFQTVWKALHTQTNSCPCCWLVTCRCLQLIPGDVRLCAATQHFGHLPCHHHHQAPQRVHKLPHDTLLPQRLTTTCCRHSSNNSEHHCQHCSHHCSCAIQPTGQPAPGVLSHTATHRRCDICWWQQPPPGRLQQHSGRQCHPGRPCLGTVQPYRQLPSDHQRNGKGLAVHAWAAGCWCFVRQSRNGLQVA